VCIIIRYGSPSYHYYLCIAICNIHTKNRRNSKMEHNLPSEDWCEALGNYLASWIRSSSNQKVLYRIETNDTTLNQIKVSSELAVSSSSNEGGKNYFTYGDNGDDDWHVLGKLSKCIGQATRLKEVELDLNMSEDKYLLKRLTEAELLCKALNTITSIERLHLHTSGGSIFGLLNPLFRQNKNLTELVVDKCKDIGRWEFFISALRDCVCLKVIKINMDIRDPIVCVGILDTLRVHQPQLESLEFPGNELAREGADTLTSLLRDSNQLNTLNISQNGINDDALKRLMPHVGKLRSLDLSGNILSSNSFRALATLLENPVCNLKELFLCDNNIRDGGARIFATAMPINRTLRTLDLRGNHITESGWIHFMHALCDSSTINSTFFSNHLLQTLVTRKGNYFLETLPSATIQYYLDLNKNEDKEKVAALKIIPLHIDSIRMVPFFEWELKCLPIVVKWFDKASFSAESTSSSPEFRHSIKVRKLQAVYEFIREMPAECAEGYFGRKSKKSDAARKRLVTEKVQVGVADEKKAHVELEEAVKKYSHCKRRSVSQIQHSKKVRKLVEEEDKNGWSGEIWGRRLHQLDHCQSQGSLACNAQFASLNE